MNKPIIGILGRPDYNKSDRNVTILYDSIRIMVEKLGGIPIVIPPIKPKLYQKINNHIKKEEETKDLDQIINLCDGIILEGGSYFYDYDIYVAKTTHQKNIPTLGICLGMQTMSCAFEGNIEYIKKNKDIHQSKEKNSHNVNINKNSKLYQIINQEKITVNSRHQEYITNTKLNIAGISEDNIIEAVEDPNKNFYIGVQWHPEDMFEYDIVSEKLLMYFIDTCKGEMYANKRNHKDSERNLL